MINQKALPEGHPNDGGNAIKKQQEEYHKSLKIDTKDLTHKKDQIQTKQQERQIPQGKQNKDDGPGL